MDYRRIENLRDMVLYRFGSTGVVQVLTRAAELLGLVPMFPIRNIHALTSTSKELLFRDCVLVPRYVHCLQLACTILILPGAQRSQALQGK